MSFSSSHPQNTTSNTNQVTTDNLNTSGNTGTSLTADNGGSAVSTSVDSGNTFISTTDQGALRAGADLASKALDVVNDNSQNLAGFSLQSLATTQDVLKSLNSSFVDAVTSFEDRSQTTLGNTVSALNQISKDENQSADQLVVSNSQTLVKYALYAAVAIAAIVFISKSKGLP